MVNPHSFLKNWHPLTPSSPACSAGRFITLDSTTLVCRLHDEGIWPSLPSALAGKPERTSRHAEAGRDIISHAHKSRAAVISQICTAGGGDPGADWVDSRGAASICRATCAPDSFTSLSA